MVFYGAINQKILIKLNAPDVNKRNRLKSLPRLNHSTLIHIEEARKQIGSIGKIYLINLPKRHDRRHNSIALLKTLHLDSFIVPALDIHSADVLSRSDLTKNGIITPVELACWASHMQIWTDIAQSSDNQSWTLILEDDVDLEMKTIEILESFSDQLWKMPDMIYLGYCGNPPGSLIMHGLNGYRIHQAINPSCTHAYAIHRHAANKLIKFISSPLRAVDDEIVDLNDRDRLSVFSIHPPLAMQLKVTKSQQSDVNPSKGTWLHFVKRLFDSSIEWIRGVEFIDSLKDSAMNHALRSLSKNQTDKITDSF